MTPEIKVERWIDIKTDQSETFRHVAQVLHASVGENFNAGGRPFKWQALSGGGERTLMQSGTLRGSLYEDYGAEFASLETTLPYARFQHFGANIPVNAKSRSFFWRKFFETGEDKWKWMALSKKNQFVIPPSPFMMFQEEDKKTIGEMLMAGIITFTDAS